MLLKEKKGLYACALFITFTLSSCYVTLYNSNTKYTISDSAVNYLISQQKYFVLHTQNVEMGIENVGAKDGNLEGKLVPLPAEHAIYLDPHTDRNNRVKAKDKIAALSEVHLYTNNVVASDSGFSLPLSSITRADVYELDGPATRTNHTLSTIGIVVGVAAIAIIILAEVSYTGF